MQFATYPTHEPTAPRPRTSHTPRRGTPPRTCTRPARTSRGRSMACAAGRWRGRPRGRSHARCAALGSAAARCSPRPPTLGGRRSSAPSWPCRGAQRASWRRHWHRRRRGRGGRLWPWALRASRHGRLRSARRARAGGLQPAAGCSHRGHCTLSGMRSHLPRHSLALRSRARTCRTTAPCLLQRRCSCRGRRTVRPRRQRPMAEAARPRRRRRLLPLH